MPNWFVYTADGTKKGPITSAQLKALADAGKINAETVLETDSGHKGKAGQVKGLIPPPEPSPFEIETTPTTPAPAASAPTTATGAFCTNCGNPISPQAVACMKCGADPRANKNFCRTCGAQLNPNQVVCVKCGCSVKVKRKSGSSGNGLGDGEKSKTLAAIFAFLLGEFGVHKFYLGDQKWGIIHIVLTIAGFTLMFIGSMLVEIDNWLSLVGSICAISGFMCIIVVSVKCLVDCIKLLLMSEEDFQERYCSE
ncbi:MAG: NINE protein [Thermoguttaceae bacterium]|nr:NINE protein [Thermoguttaceae bacterium]